MYIQALLQKNGGNELFKTFHTIVESWNCFLTLQIFRAMSRQILRFVFAFFLFCLFVCFVLLLLLFFNWENLNYVTITDLKFVLDFHRKNECIPDHELRNLDKGWRLICICFVFVSCKGWHVFIFWKSNQQWYFQFAASDYWSWCVV